MVAVTYTDLRQNLSAYINNVVLNQNPLIITRKNSENVVLISIDEYNSLIETNYLLSNEANAAHLRKSIAQHRAGRVKTRELCENE
jgi:antitoxin YefM